MKLTSSERHILSFLIFTETWHQLLDESALPSGVLRADLMHLISHGFIEVYLQDCRTSVSPFYDSDNLGQYAFKATKSGLKAIQQYAV